MKTGYEELEFAEKTEVVQLFSAEASRSYIDSISFYARQASEIYVYSNTEKPPT